MAVGVQDRAGARGCVPVVAALVAVGSLTLAGWGGPVAPNRGTPKGWRTVVFARAAISIPQRWVVRRDSNCPDAQAPGTLLLGLPAVLEHCPAVPASASWVTMTAPDLAASSSRLRAPGQLMVHGVRIDVGFGSPLVRQWDAPSLDVQVEAFGPLSGRILPTLRRATGPSPRRNPSGS